MKEYTIINVTIGEKSVLVNGSNSEIKGIYASLRFFENNFEDVLGR